MKVIRCKKCGKEWHVCQDCLNKTIKELDKNRMIIFDEAYFKFLEKKKTK